MSAEVLRVEQGSLYPALHRMEEDGWISARMGDAFTDVRGAKAGSDSCPMPWAARSVISALVHSRGRAVFDVFIPSLAHAETAEGSNMSVRRTARGLVHFDLGVSLDQAEQKLSAALRREREVFAEASGMLRNTPACRQKYLAAKLSMHSAAT